MYLGIDIGTSSVKALIAGDDGAVVTQSSTPLAVSRPRDLWSEQAPDDWWQATEQAVRTLDARARGAVRAIGLSGQMHGATLLDARDRVLRPAILWNDGRSGAECTALEARQPRTRTITGNPAMPGFTAPKLIWVAQYEPETFARIAKVLLPKDYVRLHMTGDHASDMSDSAGTLWLDVAARAWSPEILAACDLTEAQMPRLYEGSEPTGTLRPEVATDWGMPQVPVAAGGGDNAAGAVGAGVIEPSDAFLSLGTSGVLFLANETFAPNPDQAVHAFCHALPDRWHQMSVILSAASCLSWVTRLTGFASEAVLLAAIDDSRLGAGPELFLPYLAGERTPHNDPHAKGMFFGLTHDTDGPALARAVLEGVAFAFADGQDALSATGAEIGTITVIGGGAQSALWGRILASALNRRLTYRAGAETGPAYGAARLARLALTGEAPADICAPPPASHIVEPDPVLVERYAKRRTTFQALYTSLKPSFRGDTT